MAEPISSEDTERLRQSLKEQEELMKALNKQYKFSLDYAMKTAMSERHRKDVIDQFTKSMKVLSGDSLGKFTKGIKEGFSAVADFSADLQTLDTAIANATDSAKKSELETQRETMARRANTVAMQAAAMDFTKAIGKNVIGGITSTAGKFVTGLQNNASATELSSTLMNSAVDMATGAASTAGQGISKMGDTALALGKPGSKLQIMGAAASLAGSALAGIAEGAGKLAKFGIEVLSKEVEKTVKSYTDMSRAGAMFANGMTGMRNSASQAGLTVDQFSKVVTENAGTLASSGMGVGEATKKMGDVSFQLDKTVGTSGKSLRREMLQLGYSFEEQAALTAEVMGDLRRGRSTALGDDKAIAQQTAEYAGSLRTIAAITGEDAKAKMQEQRKAATQVAFRLKLQELEQKQPGITQKMLASMATMDETSKKALMEQMTIGTVIDKSANIMSAGSQAYADKISGIANLAESGAFTTEKAQMIQAEANDRMQGDLANFREIGIAGMTGSLSDLNAAISGQIENMDRITVSAVESSQKLVNQQKGTTDELTAQTMAAAEAAQKLKLQLQDVLTPAIAKFATVSAEMLGAVQKQLAELGLGGSSGSNGEPGFFAKYGDKLKAAGVGAMTGAGAGAQVGGLAGTMTMPLVGTVAGGTVGAVVGGIAGALTGWFSEKEGKALGGIAEGPESGYLEKLHGNEAVIPLGDNRSVPVKLDLVGIGNALANMSGTSAVAGAARDSGGAMGALTAQARMQEDSAALMREQISVLNEIREVLANSKDLQQQYVYNSYT